MHKKILLNVLLVVFVTFTQAQKITLSDIKAIAIKSTDEVAESLIDKGFMVKTYPQGKIFEFYKGDQTLDIDFQNKNPYINYKFITICFPSYFNNDYKLIVAQIKSQGKKLSFFKSTNYNIYITEYLLSDKAFVYVCTGFCESLDHETQYGALFISNQSIKDKLL